MSPNAQEYQKCRSAHNRRKANDFFHSDDGIEDKKQMPAERKYFQLRVY